MTKDRVSIIVPAFNEEKNIQKVLEDLNKLRKKYDIQLIVVDDASFDRTFELAKKSGADLVILHKKNKGKGAGFKTGLIHATGDFIVQFDADGQLKASDIPKLIEVLIGGADVALGARYTFSSLFNSKFTSLIKMSGNLFVSLLTTIFTGKVIIDVMTGLKAFKKQILIHIIPNSNDFAYEAELVIRASKNNYKIRTVQISCRERQSGQSNLNSIQHGLSVMRIIIKTAIFS